MLTGTTLLTEEVGYSESLFHRTHLDFYFVILCLSIFSPKVNFSFSSFPHSNARTKAILSFIPLQLFPRNVCTQTQNQILDKMQFNHG